MSRKPYTTDLTDAQWQALKETLPRATRGRTGRPRKHDPREVVCPRALLRINALLYLPHNGCTWRDLPHDFPPWHNVYDQFRRWREDATIECVHDALREKARTLAGREPTPSAAIVDSRSVKTCEKGAPAQVKRPSASTAASSSGGASATSP